MVEEPRNSRRTTHSLYVARGCVVLGLIASLFGNVASAWPDPVLMGFGVAASFGLPAAVALWRAIPVTGWWRRLRRGVVMFVIAAAAAVYTFAHVVSLQMAHGQHRILAMCVTALIEGLVVMAVLTLHAAAEPAAPAAAPAIKRPPISRRTPAPEPSLPDATVTRLPRTGTKREQAVAWLRAQQATGRDLDTVTAAEVDRVIGGNDYARKHLTDWRAELAATRREVAQ